MVSLVKTILTKNPNKDRSLCAATLFVSHFASVLAYKFKVLVNSNLHHICRELNSNNDSDNN